MAKCLARHSVSVKNLGLLTAAGVAFTASVALSQLPPNPSKADPTTPSVPFPNFSFDVASIRQNQADEHACSHIISSDRDGRFTTINLPLKPLLQFAFDLPESQIVGVPSALGTEKFDIEARSDSAVDEQISKLNREQSKLQKRHMIQALLNERFKLASRVEIRQLLVYNLVTTRGGSKLPESKSTGKTFNTLHGKLDDQGVTIAGLAEQLAQQLGRPVVDKTALTGRYDVLLQWTPEETTQAVATDAPPPLMTAVQEQLGLKLEATKGPVEILVVDHIEEPSPN
jgi:uncharacterized protein (TIGR03435 family)